MLFVKDHVSPFCRYMAQFSVCIGSSETLQHLVNSCGSVNMRPKINMQRLRVNENKRP